MPDTARRRGSVAQLVSSSYVTVAFGLITGPITARVLGPSGRGELAAASVYAAMIAVIAGLGLPNAVAYWLATGKSSVSSLLGAMFRYAALIATLTVIAGVFSGLALHGFSAAGRLGVAVLIALSPVVIVAHAVNAMIGARGELGVLARTRLLSLGLPAAAVLGLWLAGSLSVLSMTITTVLTMGAVLWYTILRLGARPSRGASLRGLLQYGIRSVLGGTAIAVSGRLDQAIIGPLLGGAALGLYAVAVTVSSLPLALSYAISTRAYAEVSRATEQRRVQVAASYVRLSVVVTIPATVALGLLIPVAMPFLYGAAFRGSMVPALLLLPSTMAAAFLSAAEAGMGALGRPGRVSIAQGAGTVVGVVSLFLLVRPLGITGAAIATSLDFVVSAIIMVIFLRQSGRCHLFPRRADLFIVVRFVALHIRRLLRVSTVAADGGV